MPLANAQANGLARAIAAKYWRLVQAQQPAETGEIRVVVVAQSANDPAQFQRIRQQMNPDEDQANGDSGLHL